MEEENKPAENWNNQTSQPTRVENKKVAAGIFALLLGSLGIHKFYLGYTNEGIIQLVLSVVTCGLAGIVPFVEGIIYLTKSDEEFYQIYQANKKAWF
jgi:TM2 domain-containing membrane protein YozV